jgi:hypothetical protein
MTARLTILIDPARKQAFEALCRTHDLTPSQVVRRLIREYVDQQQPQPRAVAGNVPDAASGPTA